MRSHGVMVGLFLLGACGASAGDGAGRGAAASDDGGEPSDAGGGGSDGGGGPADGGRGGGQDGGNGPADGGSGGGQDGGGQDGGGGGSDGGSTDQPPQISGEAVATEEDIALSFPVTASDPGGRLLTITASAPDHGSVVVSGLAVTYLPVANYNGADAFVMTASNGERNASATVDVIVLPVNDAPVATDDAFAVQRNAPLVLAHAALLGNDSDIDGDTLTVESVSGATHGAVANDGGEITFTPDRDFTGAASYRYTVTDGFADATATVAISVDGSSVAPVATNNTADRVHGHELNGFVDARAWGQLPEPVTGRRSAPAR